MICPCYEKLLLDTIVKANVRPQGRRLRRREKALQRQINAEFSKQAKAVISKTNRLLGKKALDDDIDNIFDNLDDAAMIDDITVASAGAMKMGADYRIKKSKLGQIGIDFSLDHPLANQYLETDRPLVLAKMTQTTKDHIKPLIQEAARSGQSPQELAKLIRENFAFSESRSLMIATNEIGTAYEYGNYVPMTDAKEAGYDVKKQWLTTGDAQVTDECAANGDMGWIEIDEPFESGDDSAPRGDHPRCRCTTLYEYQ